MGPAADADNGAPRVSRVTPGGVMKRLLLATMLALAAPVVVWPQAKTPDFSGTWRSRGVSRRDRARRRIERRRLYECGMHRRAHASSSPRPRPRSRWIADRAKRSGSTDWMAPSRSARSDQHRAGRTVPVQDKGAVGRSQLGAHTRQGLNQQRDILTQDGPVLNITRDTETPPGSGIDIRLVYRKASS